MKNDRQVICWSFLHNRLFRQPFSYTRFLPHIYLWGMIKIFVVSKSKIIIIFFLLVSLFLSIIAMITCHQNTFTNKPAYTVVNRWYDNNERRINLNDYVITDDVTFHTTISASHFTAPKLIVKTKNANVFARTNGKVIVNTKVSFLSGYGTHYNIIDADDLDSSQVYLRLSPCKGRKGKIKGTVYLTTQNDFQYSFLSKSLPVMAFIILLFILFAVLFVKSLKRRDDKLFFVSACLFFSAMYSLCKSCLIQFVSGNQPLIYILSIFCGLMIAVSVIFSVLNIKKNLQK